METTCQFLQIFDSQIFDSFDEFHSKLKEFEKLSRSIYIINNSKKFEQAGCDRDQLVFSRVEYICYHFDVCECDITKLETKRNPRNICSSRLSLSARNGKLCINKYNMVHNHLPLPDNVEINNKIRTLKYEESEKHDLLCDEIQSVLNNLVGKAPRHDISDGMKMDSPDKDARSCERKAAARDRLAVRAKRDRGIKLVPCLRRLTEIASSVPEKRFQKHVNELEVLTRIWGGGNFSCLLSRTKPPQLSLEEPNDASINSSNANNASEKTPNIDSKCPSVIPSFVRARSSKRNTRVPPVFSPDNSNNLSPAEYPYNTRRKGVRSAVKTKTKEINYSDLSNFVSKSKSIIGKKHVSPNNEVKNVLPFPQNFPINEQILTDLRNSLSQLPNGSNIYTQNNSAKQTNQSILGYILQPIHGESPAFPQISTTQPLINIAPKSLIPEILQPFNSLSSSKLLQPFQSSPSSMLVQPFPFLQPTNISLPCLPLTPLNMEQPPQTSPAPELVKPQLPIHKPKSLKPRVRRMKSTVPLIESQSPAPVSSSVSDKGKSKKLPWTPVIMEGDSCPYFLYVEDVNFCYSSAEDAWLPFDQKTKAINT